MTITAISQATLQTACLACANALDAGDYTTARTKYAVAEAILAGLPQSGGKGGTSMQYRQQLAGLKAAIEAVEAIGSRAADNRRMITTETSFG